MKWRPKGVMSRSVYDWNVSRIMAGQFNSPAVAAQSSYLRVFNNSTDGSWMYGIGFTITTVYPNGCFIEWSNGTEGSTAGVAQPQPLNPMSQGLPGQFYNFSSPTCVAHEIGWITSNSTNESIFWPYDWPFCVVPPNYSIYLHTGGTNVQLAGSIWVAFLPAPA